MSGAECVREARIQSLRSEFDAESVDDFTTKFTMLVGQIRELGETMEEKYVMEKLLRAVFDKFINVASSMALFGDINQMAVEEAIRSLKAHKELLKGRDTRTEEQLLMTRGYDSSRGRGHGGGRGEWCKDKSKMRCFDCEEFGHYSYECPKKRKDEKALLATAHSDDEPALL